MFLIVFYFLYDMEQDWEVSLNEISRSINNDELPPNTIFYMEEKKSQNLKNRSN